MITVSITKEEILTVPEELFTHEDDYPQADIIKIVDAEGKVLREIKRE